MQNLATDLSTLQLGPLKHTYRKISWGTILQFVSLIVFDVIITAFLLLNPGFDNFGPVRGLFVGFFYIVSLLIAIYILRLRNTRIQVHAHGLAIEQAGQVVRMRWEELSTLYFDVYAVRENVMKANILRLWSTHGQMISLDNSGNLAQIEELGNIIARHMRDTLMPDLLSRFNRGETLYFGELTLSQRGIGNGHEVVPWLQVESVRRDRTLVDVQDARGWHHWRNIKSADTPNLFLFWSILDQVMDQRSGLRSPHTDGPSAL